MKKELEEYLERNGVAMRDVLVIDDGNEYLQYLERRPSGEVFVDVIVASDGKFRALRRVWGDGNAMITLNEHDINASLAIVKGHIITPYTFISFSFSTGKYFLTANYGNEGTALDMFVTESEPNSGGLGRSATALLKPSEKPRILDGFNTIFTVEDNEDRFKLIGQGEHGAQLELNYPKKIDVGVLSADALGHQWRNVLKATDPTTGLSNYPSLRFSYEP